MAIRRQEDSFSQQIAPARYVKTITASDLTNDYRPERGANAMRNNTASNLTISVENIDGTVDAVTLLPLEVIPFVPYIIRASDSGNNINSAAGFSINIFYTLNPKSRT